MRLLHILGAIEYSGAEIMLKDSASLMKASDVQLHALSTNQDIGAMADQIMRHGFTVYHLPFAKHPMFFVRLSRLLRRKQPDVVHLHTERGAFWIELTCRLSGVKRIIRTIHSSFEFTGGLRTRRSLQRRLASKYFGVTHVFVSPSVETIETSRFGTAGVTICNFVDSRRFCPNCSPDAKMRWREEHGMPSDALLIVSVGRCIELKGHTAVLHALVLIRDLTPKAFYIHVGTGPEEMEERELARQLGIASRVLFMGQQDDIPAILQACDIFVMPSLYEGSSIAVLEAASCGLPIVAYDVPGLRGAVVQGETGLLVKPEVTALAEGISQLLLDEGSRKRLGNQGRARTEREFSMERWVANHLAIYGAGASID
jgi:glycosyltransferase involved in cell wall biosynthesis